MAADESLFKISVASFMMLVRQQAECPGLENSNLPGAVLPFEAASKPAERPEFRAFDIQLFHNDFKSVSAGRFGQERTIC